MLGSKQQGQSTIRPTHMSQTSHATTPTSTTSAKQQSAVQSRTNKQRYLVMQSVSTTTSHKRTDTWLRTKPSGWQPQAPHSRSSKRHTEVRLGKHRRWLSPSVQWHDLKTWFISVFCPVLILSFMHQRNKSNSFVEWSILNLWWIQNRIIKDLKNLANTGNMDGKVIEFKIWF